MGKFIGLTGNFGCGKSTVAKIFEELGAAIIDADKLNTQVLQNDKTVQKQLLTSLGKVIQNSDGGIDKQKLAELIFTSKADKKKVEDILHPAICTLAQTQADTYFKSGKEIVIFEATLLIESGFHKQLDGLILVTCDSKIERERFNQNSEKQKLAKFYNHIITSQMSQEEKKKFTEWIIDNSKSRKNTQEQVKKIWSRYFFQN